VVVKKTTSTFPNFTTISNIDEFPKFFHRQIQHSIFNDTITTKDGITLQMLHYTNVWISIFKSNFHISHNACSKDAFMWLEL